MKKTTPQSNSSPSDDSLDLQKAVREQDREILHQIRYNRKTLDFLLERRKSTPLLLEELQQVTHPDSANANARTTLADILNSTTLTADPTSSPAASKQLLAANSQLYHSYPLFSRTPETAPNKTSRASPDQSPSKVTAVKSKSASGTNLSAERKNPDATERNRVKLTPVKPRRNLQTLTQSQSYLSQQQKSLSLNPLYTMAGNLFKLPTFSGEHLKNENSSRFLRQVEYFFAPLASQYSSDGLNLDTAKAFFLQNNTSSIASTWVGDQEDNLLDNWDALKQAFIVRFLMHPKENRLPEALQKFYTLKQLKRLLSKYFDKARFIHKHLPKKLHEQLAEKTIRGLNDQIVRRVVGGIMRKKKKSLDNVLRTIQSATRATSEDKEMAKPNENAVKDSYAAMDPKDRIFSKTINETMNVLKALQVSTQGGGNKTTSYRNQASYENQNPNQLATDNNQGGNAAQDNPQPARPMSAPGYQQ